MEERNYIKEFIEAMNNGTGYTFLSEHGHEMSKNDLSSIAKELLFAIEDAELLDIDLKTIFSIATENLDM